MFKVTKQPASVYVSVPIDSPKKKQLARELDCNYFELPNGCIEVTSEDELALNDLCESLDHLHIEYLDART